MFATQAEAAKRDWLADLDAERRRAATNHGAT
jgi:hypothetical protein